MKHLLAAVVFIVSAMAGAEAFAQDPLEFSTVERPPFSMIGADGTHTGFAIDLLQAIASETGRDVTFRSADSFGAMLDAVRNGEVDGAVANISITAAREREMDFSQPIFSSGLQIMVPLEAEARPFWTSLMRRDILYAILFAMGLLFGAGMLMWVFERKKQPYFDRPFHAALFPSFWYALNLIVNGGFEERMPQSRPGRVLSVLLVISSLFLVSIFVASITASVTVQALNTGIHGLSDLEDQRIGTVMGSTAAEFLDERELRYVGFDGPAEMLAGFSDGDLDAVFFDAPILAYYTLTDGAGEARLLERNYRPENYGIALTTGSSIREDFDRALLGLRESGAYDALFVEWFGPGSGS